MELDKLKLKRLCEAKRLRGRIARTTKALVRTTRRLTTDEKGRQIYADQPGISSAKEDVDEPKKNASNQSGGTLDEGKRPHTPDFVQHCVTAITEKPTELSRVEKGAPEGADGSPFGICWAKYKGNKRGLAAKHATGKHHTVDQYKRSLATLREDVEEARRQNADRREITLEEDVDLTPTAVNRHLIRYVPRD